MCQTFYKYFLITCTSFMASSGLYFVILTRWLWPLPISDYSPYNDWRIIPQCIGAICLLFYSAGLLIVLRGRAREIFYLAILLQPSLLGIVVLLIVQIVNKKEAILDLSDIFLLVVILLYIVISVNLFLLRRSIIQRAIRRTNTYRHRYKKGRNDMEVDL